VLCQKDRPATGLVKTSTGVVADDGHSCAQGEIRTLAGAWHEGLCQWARFQVRSRSSASSAFWADDTRVVFRGARRLRQNAFLYRASASLLPYIHIGSPHSLGPWSVIQAALQGGAATSRPSNMPCACAIAALLLVRSWAIVGVASDDMSNSAVITCIIFIVRFLACGVVPIAAVNSLGTRCLSCGRRSHLLDRGFAEMQQ
jgi:hypothetical protein